MEVPAGVSLLAEKGGVLSVQATNRKRHLVALAAGVSMVVAPLVLLNGGGIGPAGVAAGTTNRGPAHVGLPAGRSASRAVALRDIQLANNKVVIPTTTTTTTAPAPPPTTTVPAPTTTTPRRVVYMAPPTTAAPAPVYSVTGIATWYAWHPGECASPTLPHGTTVRVTNLATGASATCVVTDTEAAGGSHVIDLDTSVFSAIANLSQGAITVSVSW